MATLRSGQIRASASLTEKKQNQIKTIAYGLKAPVHTYLDILEEINFRFVLKRTCVHEGVTCSPYQDVTNTK